MDRKIPLSAPHMAADVLAGLEAAIEGNWIAHVGPSVDAFERELADRVSAADALATHSGTAALHLALRVLGVGRGDVVLCSALTFIASATPILYVGATPVFIDADDSGTMSVDALAVALAALSRVKCIIVVHLYGQPANMPAILELSERHGIPVVEDAAQALGSTCGGRWLGTLGRLGTYSFAGNKIITTSTGGALVSTDPALIERARWLAQQAREQVPHYEHSELGYNYRLSNVLAELGRSQLRVLSDRVQARRAKFARYRGSLADVPGISWLPEPPWGTSNRWLSVMLLERGTEPGRLIGELAKRGIEARRVFKPLHLQPLFTGTRYQPHPAGSPSVRLFESGVCLPSSSNLSEADQRYVIDALEELLGTCSTTASVH